MKCHLSQLTPTLARLAAVGPHVRRVPGALPPPRPRRAVPVLVGARRRRPPGGRGSGRGRGFSPLARLAAVVLHVLVRLAVVLAPVARPPGAVAVLVLAVVAASSGSPVLAPVHRLQLEQVLRGEAGSLFSIKFYFKFYFITYNINCVLNISSTLKSF